MTDEYYKKYERTIVMDIDNTLSFSDTYGDVNAYANAKPNKDIIKVMQKMDKLGYTFILHTSRGYISCNEDTAAAEKKYREQIETWMHKHNVPYEKLVFGKPYAAIAYVDDKGLRPDEFIERFR